ncbi:hypothetical protein HK100_001163 [Physocladia obscura]|uniref:Uncharacterized protein n=1 Tax=Physocladia obscura TaxID=109957 RepID=A0AAD5XF22_9FUNG|nr:hypothetical protein HK100_001163 [Physocladia obscura]
MAALASETSDNSLTCDCSCGTVKVSIGQQICGVTFGGGVIANATATTDGTTQLSCISICSCYCSTKLTTSTVLSPSTTLAVWFGVSSAAVIVVLLVYLYGRILYLRNTTPEQRRQNQLERRIQSNIAQLNDTSAGIEALPVYQEPLPAYQKTNQTEPNESSGERDVERNTTYAPPI